MNRSNEKGRFISAILLAAGKSVRMGKLKQLLPFGDRTVIERVADNILESGVDELVVVLGHRHREIETILASKKAKTVVNPDYEEGMHTSTRCGLLNLDGRADTVLLALIDQPLIGPAVIKRVIEEYRDGPKDICIPSHQMRRGHPVVFHIKYKKEILKALDAGGLKEVWGAHPDDIHHVVFDTDVILLDMDRWEDYQAQLRRIEDDDMNARE